MITGNIYNQYLCPIDCNNAFIVFTDLNNNNNEVIINTNGPYIIPNTPEGNIPDLFTDGRLISIKIFCDTTQMYSNIISFPLDSQGNHLEYNDLNFIVSFDTAINCSFEEGGTKCNFYLIQQPCSTTICVYNTQATNHNQVLFNFGDSAIWYVGPNVCHTYRQYGTFTITQKVQRIEEVPGSHFGDCCGVVYIHTDQQVIVECIKTKQVTIVPYLASCNFTIDPLKGCCSETDAMCITRGSSLQFTPRFPRDEGCEQVLCQWALDLTIPAMTPNGFIGIGENAFNVRGQQAYIRNGVQWYPEYLRYERICQYNIGRQDFAFEFWIDPKLAYTFLANEGMIVIRWEAQDQVDNQQDWIDGPNPQVETNNCKPQLVVIPDPQSANGANIGAQTECSCILRTGNVVEFRLSKVWGVPLANSCTVRSNPNLLIPGQFNHVVLCKSTNNAVNWDIYINGTNSTNIFQNNLPLNWDNLDWANGPIAIGAEWTEDSRYPFVDNALPGEMAFGNQGNFIIRNLRFYNRVIPEEEVETNFIGGPCSDPSNFNNLLLYSPLNQNSGAIAPEEIFGNNGFLPNQNPNLDVYPNNVLALAPLGVNNPALNYSTARLAFNGGAWVNACCFPFRWTVTRQDRDEDNNVIPIIETILTDGPLIYNFNEYCRYTICLSYVNCCGECTCCEDIFVGPELFLDRLGCLNFRLVDNYAYQRIEDNDPNPPNNTTIPKLELKLYRVDGTLEYSYTEENYIGSKEFAIVLPFDGMYILDYRVLNGRPDNLVLRRERFVIYEFCTILSCYKKLLMDMNCVTCEPCDLGPNSLADMNRRMFELNQFMANFSAFLYKIAVYSGVTNNNFLFREKYLTFLQDTQLIIENLLRFCGKCGYVSKSGNIPIRCLPKLNTSCCNG